MKKFYFSLALLVVPTIAYAAYVHYGDMIVTGDLESNGVLTGVRIVSSQATGTAPLTVASTTIVTNLNADLLDGESVNSVVSAQRVGSASPSLDNSDASIEWEDADSLDAIGKIITGSVAGDALANTAVTAGSYTSANITVDADGRLTYAENGNDSDELTPDELAAINGANAPSGSNVMATMLDVTDAGGGDMMASMYDPTGIEGSSFARTNHTGTQTANTISDFNIVVSGNSAVVANTAKVTYPGAELTSDELAAINSAATAPTAANPFVTEADAGGGGSLPAATDGQMLQSNGVNNYESVSSIGIDLILADEIPTTTGQLTRDGVTGLRMDNGSGVEAFSGDSIIADASIVDASGFDGNLGIGDTSIQEVAQVVDDLSLTGSAAWTEQSSDPVAGDLSTGDKVVSTSSGDLFYKSATGFYAIAGDYTVDSGDSTPDAFSFTDETDVAVSTLTTHAALTLAGTDVNSSISIAGNSGEYQINTDGWVTASGTISPGDDFQVRQTSSASDSTQTDTTLTIDGSVSDTYSITTASGSACSDCITYWAADNDTLDIAGGTDTVTRTNATFTTGSGGYVGEGLDCSASNEYAEFSAVGNIDLAEGSIEMMVNFVGNQVDLSETPYFFNIAGTTMYATISSTTIRLRFGGVYLDAVAGTDYTALTAANGFYKIKFIWDATNVTTELDDVVIKTTTHSETLSGQTTFELSGEWAGSLQGILDEVKIR